MSEWDNLNRWEKARITRTILYGTPDLVDLLPRGPRSEETKEKIRETKKKNWANLTPEEQKEWIRPVLEWQANLTPEEREAWYRSRGEGNNNKKAWETRRKLYGPSGFREGKSPVSNPEFWKTRKERYGPSGVKDPEAFGRALSEGKRKARERRQQQE